MFAKSFPISLNLGEEQRFIEHTLLVLHMLFHRDTIGAVISLFHLLFCLYLSLCLVLIITLCVGFCIKYSLGIPLNVRGCCTKRQKLVSLNLLKSW